MRLKWCLFFGWIEQTKIFGWIEQAKIFGWIEQAKIFGFFYLVKSNMLISINITKLNLLITSLL